MKAIVSDRGQVEVVFGLLSNIVQHIGGSRNLAIVRSLDQRNESSLATRLAGSLRKAALLDRLLTVC